MTGSDTSRTARLLARVRAAEDADGRLAPADMAGWDIFPYEVEPLVVRRLADPVVPEPPRQGVGGVGCRSCARGVDGAVWHDERWKLVAPAPTAMPIVLLEPLAHLDQCDLPPDLAADLGPMMLRVEAALLSLGGIERVHLMRIGDGGEHLHWWCVTRPTGLLQLQGSSLIDWLDILPPMPQDEWDETMQQVAAAMGAPGRPPS